MSIVTSIILLRPYVVNLIMALSLSYAIQLIYTKNTYNKLKNYVIIRHNSVLYINTHSVFKSHSETALLHLNNKV